MQKLYLLILLILIVQFGICAKAPSKTPSKATNDTTKPQMGIPFNYKHTNSATFYDEQNVTTTTRKPKLKRQKRLSENEFLDANAKRYAFSFKTLAELDLPLSEHGDDHQDYNKNNYGEFSGLSRDYQSERNDHEFLGKFAPQIAKPSKTRLTEQLIKGLTPEQIPTSSNVSHITP